MSEITPYILARISGQGRDGLLTVGVFPKNESMIDFRNVPRIVLSGTLASPDGRCLDLGRPL